MNVEKKKKKQKTETEKKDEHCVKKDLNLYSSIQATDEMV